MPTDRVQEIAIKHELGGWLENQFVLDRRCLDALVEMQAETCRETIRECAEIARKFADKYCGHEGRLDEVAEDIVAAIETGAAGRV